MSVGDEFARLVGDDELCAVVRQAVENNDEDALRRLGFGGFGGYAQRLSELMSDSVREGHDPQAEDFAAIMEEVARPAHYAHHLVNEAGTAVQRAKDKPLGIHMKPQETDFDDEAFRSTVGNAASKGDPTETVGALADGLGYFVKKLGNDFIKANAEAHSRAGFEVKVKRSGSTKCCPWCAARIGSWAIANAPDGVFGCHANCSCTVEYTSSTGAKTSARGANLHRYGAGAFVEAEYQPPHVGAVQGAKKVPHRLTGGENGGIINPSNSRDRNNNQLLLEAENPFKNPKMPLQIDDVAQSKHIKGGKRYVSYMNNNKYEPSMLTISSDEIQKLVDKYHGTGIIKLDRNGKILPQETIIDNDNIIGYVSNNQDGTIQPTSAFKIMYSMKGTHIVPTYESKKAYWSERRAQNGYDWLLRQKG